MGRRLRRASQLRALCRRLPHVPTPRETLLLSEFAKMARRDVESCSVEALQAGFRAAWRARDFGAIVAVARRLTSAQIEADPLLSLLVAVATERGAV